MLAFSSTLILLGSLQHQQNLFIEAMEESDLHGHHSCPANRHSGVSAVRDVYRQQQQKKSVALTLTLLQQQELQPTYKKQNPQQASLQTWNRVKSIQITAISMNSSKFRQSKTIDGNTSTVQQHENSPIDTIKAVVNQSEYNWTD